MRVQGERHCEFRPRDIGPGLPRLTGTQTGRDVPLWADRAVAGQVLSETVWQPAR